MKVEIWGATFQAPARFTLHPPLAAEGPTGHLDFYSDDLGELKGIICSVVRQIFAVSSGTDKKTKCIYFKGPPCMFYLALCHRLDFVLCPFSWRQSGEKNPEERKCRHIVLYSGRHAIIEKGVSHPLRYHTSILDITSAILRQNISWNMSRSLFKK